MGGYLQMLNLEKLKALKIQSDPINNKGLKVVMKLYLPQLEKIWFENTNLSTDCGNSIAKMAIGSQTLPLYITARQIL